MANLAQLMLGAAWIPMFFFVNLYLQQVLGLGALASGAALLPLTVTIMIGMIAAAPHEAAAGSRQLHGIHAAVVHPRRPHLDRAGAGEHLPRLVRAAAHHQPPPILVALVALVALVGEPGEVVAISARNASASLR